MGAERGHRARPRDGGRLGPSPTPGSRRGCRRPRGRTAGRRPPSRTWPAGWGCQTSSARWCSCAWRWSSTPAWPPSAREPRATPALPYPTFALALTLFEHPTWDALAPDGPLRAWRLIEVHQRGEERLLSSPLRIDERILHHAKGLACVDERLAPLACADAVRRRGGVTPGRPPSGRSRTPSAGRARGRDGAFIYLLGSDPEAGRELAEGASSALGLLLRRLSTRVLEAPEAEADALARLLRRECLLGPLALYLDARELEPAAAPAPGIPGRLAGPGGGPLFVGLEEIPTRRAPGRSDAGRRAADAGRAAGGLGRGARPRRGRPAGPAREPVPPGPVGPPQDRPRGEQRRPSRPPGVPDAALGRLPARRPGPGSSRWPSAWSRARPGTTSSCRRRSSPCSD